jgi:hypothetical protein
MARCSAAQMMVAGWKPYINLDSHVLYKSLKLLAVRPVHLAAGSDGETNFGVTKGRRAESGVVQRREILARGSTGSVPDLLRLPLSAWDRCTFALLNIATSNEAYERYGERGAHITCLRS